MMRCRTFVELIASQRLDEAPDSLSLGERFGATLHRRLCHRCRAFEANDRVLSDLLRTYRVSLLGASEGEGAAPSASIGTEP